MLVVNHAFSLNHCHDCTVCIYQLTIVNMELSYSTCVYMQIVTKSIRSSLSLLGVLLGPYSYTLMFMDLLSWDECIIMDVTANRHVR